MTPEQTMAANGKAMDNQAKATRGVVENLINVAAKKNLNSNQK